MDFHHYRHFNYYFHYYYFYYYLVVGEVVLSLYFIYPLIIFLLKEAKMVPQEYFSKAIFIIAKIITKASKVEEMVEQSYQVFVIVIITIDLDLAIQVVALVGVVYLKVLNFKPILAILKEVMVEEAHQIMIFIIIIIATTIKVFDFKIIAIIIVLAVVIIIFVKKEVTISSLLVVIKYYY